ncbi:hypothetical protein OR16_10758 [Cupriavidus basilensis OR16]|uniref:Uncharacterized protein n=1 Tax=Cupriavidus basilensis OR16 TaxID=1127483 RepID=H1S337_9BURK|nr:hypothetical protein OR16_10758 [Cupriavidus basilensis OR16]
MVARTQSGNVRANRLHHARYFMPQHGWERQGISALHHMQIAMTQAHGGSAHQHLMRGRLPDGNVMNGKRCADLLQ